MKRALVLLLLALLASCRGDARRRKDAAGDATPGGDGGAFVILGDPDTVATERFTRTPGRVSGRILHGDGTRIEYDAVVARDESITRLELRLWHAGASPDSPPAERSSTSVHGPGRDSLLRLDRKAGAPERRLVVVVPGGAQPYFLPSVGLGQQLLRRARRLGGDSAQLGIVLLNGAASPQRVSVHWLPGDSVELRVPGGRVRLALDPQGRILGGSNPQLRMRLKALE